MCIKKLKIPTKLIANLNTKSNYINVFIVFSVSRSLLLPLNNIDTYNKYHKNSQFKIVRFKPQLFRNPKCPPHDCAPKNIYLHNRQVSRGLKCPNLTSTTIKCTLFSANANCLTYILVYTTVIQSRSVPCCEIIRPTMAKFIKSSHQRISDSACYISVSYYLYTCLRI